MNVLYTKSEYAKLKNVSAQYIGKIINKLQTKKIGSITMIKNCADNDKLFTRPAWNHKKKTEIEYQVDPCKIMKDAYNNRKNQI